MGLAGGSVMGRFYAQPSPHQAAFGAVHLFAGRFRFLVRDRTEHVPAVAVSGRLRPLFVMRNYEKGGGNVNVERTANRHDSFGARQGGSRGAPWDDYRLRCELTGRTGADARDACSRTNCRCKRFSDCQSKSGHVW